MTSISEMMDEVNKLTSQIIDLCHPQKIILFGSVAAEVIHKNSDIDLCIVTEYEDKRELLTTLYSQLESTVGFDLVLYRPEDWEKHSQESASFAHLINTKGKLIYG